MRQVSALGIGLLAILQSLNAYAFTLNLAQVSQNGQTQNLTFSGWQTTALTFDIDSSCSSNSSVVNDAVTGAIDLWNRVPSANITVSLGTTVQLPQALTAYVGSSATTSAPAGNPIIVCASNFATDTGEDASNIPGFAGAFNLDASSGKIRGALLVLNIQSGATANIVTLGASVVKQILAHEIGHVLGLGHSADENALMYYQTSLSKVATLALDDVAGITYLYPRQEPSSGKAFGCAMISSGRNKKDQGGFPTGMAECICLGFICLWGWSYIRKASLS